MKVAIIGAHGYPIVYGGYETFVANLAEGLVGKKIDVTVYCIKNNFTNYPKCVNGIKLKYFYTIRKKNFSQLIYSFQSVINTIFCNYDIILLLNSSNGIWGIVYKLFKKNALINVDGIEWERPKWKGLGAYYFRFSSWIATKYFKYIITDAEEMSRIYKEKWNAESTVITYGAKIVYNLKSNIHKEFNITRHEYYLIVGRLVPDNNLAIIVKEYLNSNSKKKLVIVGDDIYNGKYAQQIKRFKSDNIIFLGYINDRDKLNDLYLNCYAYIHGHEFGGTNPTLLEALSCGCCVIALETKFNCEVLDHGKYGTFFKKKIGSLSNIINYFDENYNEVSYYSSKARERIIMKYNWDLIVNDYISLFKKVLTNVNN